MEATIKPLKEMELTTTTQLSTYLTSHPQSHLNPDTLEQFSGGNANYVWRTATISGKSAIVKHAAPYARFSPPLPLSVDRMDSEHRALPSLPSVLPTNGTRDVLSMTEVYAMTASTTS